MILEKKKSYSTYQNFTCQASEAYPQPTVFLFKDTEEQDVYDKTSLESVEWTTQKHSNGKFSVAVTSTIKSSKLDYGSLIFCELRIPGTGYVKRKSLLYYPPGMQCFGNNLFIEITVFVFGVMLVTVKIYYLPLLRFAGCYLTICQFCACRRGWFRLRSLCEKHFIFLHVPHHLLYTLLCREFKLN
ncbi:Immunoglobulin, partial [Oryctes borbonicus]